VVIGEDEILRFRPDVYGRDAVLKSAMFDSGDGLTLSRTISAR